MRARNFRARPRLSPRLLAERRSAEIASDSSRLYDRDLPVLDAIALGRAWTWGGGGIHNFHDISFARVAGNSGR